MSEVDWTKPLQTRYGRPARLVDDHYRSGNGRETHPMLVIVTGVDGSEWLSRHDRAGLKRGCGAGDPDTIINVPEKHEVWLNIYRVGDVGNTFTSGTVRGSREAAEAEGRGSPRLAARVRVEFEEGEGL